MQHDRPRLRRVLRSVSATLAYLPRTLHLVWEAAPRWTAAYAILVCVQGIMPGALVAITKVVVDSLAVLLGTSPTWREVQPALIVVALAAGLLATTELVRHVTDWVRAALGEHIQDHIASLLHQQSVAVDLAFYESSDYYDHLDQARSEASARTRTLLEQTGSLLQNGITLLAMSAILLPYGAWLPVLLVVATLPAFYVVLRFDQRYHAWWKRTTGERRRVHYYDVMLTNSMAAPEVRLFGLGGHFQVAYQALRRRLRSERLLLMKRQSLARFGASAFALVIFGGAMASMVWRGVLGLLTLGDLALFYQAFTRGEELMRSSLGSIGQLYTNSVFLGNLFAFLELPPRVTDPQEPRPAPTALRHGVTFRDITFRYPGSERPALQDFNLLLPAGKIVAIVGVNGAGKTTLVKLLCRFYDPEAGAIELDGIDIRDLRVDDLRRSITTLFQFPMQYQASAAQNIGYGDIATTPSPADLRAAARSAGAHELIAGLPHGYDTHLGKWFEDGVELSGGEWQRIAMARAYLRQSPILVLDEPTSAMDSWAEADWFERLRILAKDRTGLIITHRFTIAMRADIIHVMEGGRIVESGSHEALLARNGRYAQSWITQTKAHSTAGDMQPWSLPLYETT